MLVIKLALMVYEVARNLIRTLRQVGGLGQAMNVLEINLGDSTAR